MKGQMICEMKDANGVHRQAVHLMQGTAAIGRAVGKLLHPQGYPHPGRVTTSGRGEPGAAKARAKRKVKNKAARKARKNR
uniref:Uncharacterized protein n=1 Tax=Pseudomonas phage HRDY3 TaxID=3236930 RepID=A0AB39CDA2_9VIRU